MPADKSVVSELDIRRHFYNEKGFQCFASFFRHWDGWVTAGHVLTDAAHAWPEFTGSGPERVWPNGLDAALKGCRLPDKQPPSPQIGHAVKLFGYPAGSRHMEHRDGVIYLERGTDSGSWIVHITSPDEPVVSGMSGGPVIDLASGEPIGIIITRNSPADLNSDRNPDESCDFVALSKLWDVIQQSKLMT